MPAVGLIVWELEIPGAHSLKEKRSVVKSLKERLHSRYRVAVAETGFQDVWQRAQLSAVTVSGEHRHVQEVLDELDRFVKNDRRALVTRSGRSYY